MLLIPVETGLSYGEIALLLTEAVLRPLRGENFFLGNDKLYTHSIHDSFRSRIKPLIYSLRHILFRNRQLSFILRQNSKNYSYEHEHRQAKHRKLIRL